MNTELAKARTAQADAQAKANLLRDMLRHGRIADIPDVANNELVRRISEQRVTAKAQLALESRTLLPAHPRIKELTAQVADLDSEIRAAADKTARSLEAEARVANVRVDNLSKALDAQKKLIGASGSDEVQLRELDRTARSLKDELDTTTTKYQEALARENSKATSSDARIFSRALAPQTPSFPKKLPIIAISTLAALVLSVGFRGHARVHADACTGGRRRPPLRAGGNAGHDRRLARAATSGRAGGGRRRAAGQIEPQIAPLARPAFAQAEGVAHPGLDDVVADIETLGLSAGGLVLSMPVAAGYDDGLALALARRLANLGRVVLVAGDAGTVTGLPGEAGLADLLDGSTSFADAIHRDRNSRLHIIPAGRKSRAGQDGLGSVLDALKGTYDIVVLGAPFAMDEAEAHAVTARTEIAVVGPGDDEIARGLMEPLTIAGVPHVLRAQAPVMPHASDDVAAA